MLFQAFRVINTLPEKNGPTETQNQDGGTYYENIRLATEKRKAGRDQQREFPLQQGPQMRLRGRHLLHRERRHCDGH